LKLNFEPNNVTRGYAKYGDDLQIAFQTLKSQDNLEVVGVNMHFGQKRLAKFREDGILMVDGLIPKITFVDWQALLTNKDHDAIGFANDLDIALDLKVNEIDFMGYNFNNLLVKASKDDFNNNWVLGINGPKVSGDLVFPIKTKNLISDSIDIDLDYLEIVKPQMAQQSFISKNLDFAYPLNFSAKKMKVNNVLAENIILRLKPIDGGYKIESLEGEIAKSKLTSSGTWYLKNPKKVDLNGQISVYNFSNALEAMGISSSIKNARGNISFSLGWLGSLFESPLPTLHGQTAISLEDGFVKGVELGIGRLLGLINIESLEKRLRLDFSDVTNKGLDFNTLTGNLTFGENKLTTDDLVIDGPSAKIEIIGGTGLDGKDIDAKIIVMPNVTGTLPLAAAIAVGNPAIGVAVWVVDKLLGRKIQEITRYKYKVSGTWAAPIVENMEKQRIRS